MSTSTVVIVTRDRAASLAETLTALRVQRRAPEWVVVVDDGSTDETVAILASFPEVQAIHTPPRGIASARNTGWRAATTDVVAFTDDDCVPDPVWLQQLLAPIEAGRADVVQGRTLPRPDHADRDGPWARTLCVESEQGYYQTANIAYRRPCLEDVGGFDDGLARVGEDTDLAWRVRAAGHRTAFAPEALVHHAIWPFSWRRHLVDRAKWADVVLVLRRHPHLRDLVHRRVWYRPSHQATTIETVLVLVGAAVRPSIGAAVAGGVVVRRARAAGRWTRDPAGRIGLALQEWVADAYETACFIRASIRHRTLLL